MRRERCLNLACGDSFLEGWINLDYAPTSSHVKKADLLGRLPLADSAVDVVYSSHFIEHIPREKAQEFLKECFRVLSPGGKIRLVCPDLEELSREYLRMRESGEHVKAEFVVLEMLDQCVRTEPGGALGFYYRELKHNPGNGEILKYIQARTGEDLFAGVGLPVTSRRWLNVAKHLARIPNILERAWCRFIVSLLPKAFREQNVSLTGVGERHTWIYDFHTLSRMLEAAGFRSVVRMTFDTSGLPDFPVRPLDVTETGMPRKGLESMYIEALKP